VIEALPLEERQALVEKLLRQLQVRVRARARVRLRVRARQG
jgi:hypothetical protein